MSDTCQKCGFVMDWNAFDHVHGSIWCCEKCGATACRKCIVDMVGEDRFMRMLDDEEPILCPDCIDREKEDPNGNVQ